MKDAQKRRLETLVEEAGRVAHSPAAIAAWAWVPVLAVGTCLCLCVQLGSLKSPRLNDAGYILVLLSLVVAGLVRYVATLWARRRLKRLLSENPDLQPWVSTEDCLLAARIEEICGKENHSQQAT